LFANNLAVDMATC